MSYINYSEREINLKVALLGAWGREPAPVEALYKEIPPDCRGRLTTIEGRASRSLFFDFLPVDTPSVRGFKIRLHIFGWAGEAPTEADTKLLLRGADGALLFGNPDSLEAFIKTRFKEEEIPWLVVGEKTKPAEALKQILKKIMPPVENKKP